jgi:uncharacterized protein YkwD
MACLVNRERAARGLPPMRLDAKLSRAGRTYSRQMARQDFFSHRSPAGIRLEGRLRQVRWVRGNGRWSATEAIGWGMERSASPARVLKVWLKHRRDRKVLLSRKPRLGIGVATGLPFRSRCRGATFTLVAGKR